MSYLIQNRKPASVFRFFEDICAIPHPSYHEEKIADYLCAFAAERGLECYRDSLHNVLIKKNATPDRADDAPLMFQGHTPDNLSHRLSAAISQELFRHNVPNSLQRWQTGQA